MQARALLLVLLLGGAEAPRPFADDSITTVNGISFSPAGDLLLVTRFAPPREEGGKRRAQIVQYKSVDGRWVGPTPSSFWNGYTDYQGVFAPDGERMYFTSTRPLPGTTAEQRQNLWVVDRDGDDWSEPRPVTGAVSPGWDGYGVPTATGWLYFVSDREGGQGAVDIWKGRLRDDGDIETPTPVIAVNSPDSDSDVYVDPNERLMLFNRYSESTKVLDLYYSTRSGGAWSKPQAITAVNGDEWELSPTLSPDGKILLFTINGRIHQIALANAIPSRS